MHIRHIEDLDDLLPYRDRWDELAGKCIFRSWTWLTTWWKHYGPTLGQLRVYLLLEDPSTAAVQDNLAAQPGSRTPPDNRPQQEQLVAILPCYLNHSLTRGRVLRLLGDGEVCSDYLDLLAAPAHQAAAAEYLAQHLLHTATDWELADFSGIAHGNTGLHHLVQCLQSQHCHIQQTPGPHCWSIPLPHSWEELLAQQSKSHRKQLRRLQRRVLETPQANWHLVETSSDLEKAWPLLMDLHQRRRQSLGEPGCFASPRWAAFQREMAARLLETGHLRLSWLELAGAPVAAEYHLAACDKTFAYQGGLEPLQLDAEPGKLSMIKTLQHAIHEGHTQFDLLRGDEPYKAHWRAVPEATTDYKIVGPRTTARLRYQTWATCRKAASQVRQWAGHTE